MSASKSKNNDAAYVKYRSFIDLYRKAYPDLKNEESWKRANWLWTKSKETGSKEIENEILKLKNKIAANESKNLNFWSNFSSPPTKKSRSNPAEQTSSCTITKPCSTNETTPNQTEEVVKIDDNGDDGGTEVPEAKKPAQEKARHKIAQLTKQITSLTELRDSGMSSVTVEQITAVRKELKKEESTLNKLQREAARQRKTREAKRNAIEKVT